MSSSTSLTIGRRIALGFAFVLLLLGVVAGVAWFALGSSGRNLAAYAGSARETSNAQQLAAAMVRVKLQVNEYLGGASTERAEAYRLAKEELERDLVAAQARSPEPARAAQLSEAAALLRDYDTAFRGILTITAQLDAVVAGQLQPRGEEIARGLQKVLTDARGNGDMNGAFKVSSALKAYFETNSYTNSFLLTSRVEHAESARKSLATLAGLVAALQRDQEELAKLDATLKDEEKETLLRQLITAGQAYGAALGEIVAAKQRRDTLVRDQLEVIAPKFTATLERMRDAVANFQSDLESRMAAAQRREELAVLLLTVAGILLGVGATWFVVRSITRRIATIADHLAAESGHTHAAAQQVAAVSAGMADAAAQQAAALEESGASLTEMSSMTQRNTEGASAAKELAANVRAKADAGTRDVAAMRGAMDAIQSSSVEISKIIKTIDDLAFQTNVLALNAAVEAARAGSAGAGFAVVADEVRNLAQRSAHAARETAGKIADAAAKSEQGARISGQVATGLQEIVAQIHQLDEMIASIATGSKEQSEGIQQLNQAVAGMDRITQANAASAQQSASSAEEMKQQAAQVRAAVDELMRLVRGAANVAVQTDDEGADLGLPSAAASEPVQRPVLAKKATASVSVSRTSATAAVAGAAGDEHFV